MARLSNSLHLLSSLSLFSVTIAPASALPVEPRGSGHFPPKDSTAATIEWSSCPPDANLPETLQCATFSVPIDWDQPYDEHFDLGIAKLPAAASNSTSKIGSLFVNPGGPGGAGSNLVAKVALGAIQDETLLASFDWIGIDPRGVGLSHQVKCDMSIYAERVSLWPKTQQDFDKLVDKNKRFGESCRKMTGPLLEHIDTISVAKDFEAVRVALGNEPLNYLGLSYGTQIGAQYAQLFPENIRALVLDAITQHSQSEATNLLVEGTSLQLNLEHFFKWASTNETSPLHGQDVQALWTSLLANATTTPIPAPGCNGTDCRADVNAEEILLNTQPYLIFASGEMTLGASWGVLASALFNATHGDATAFSTRFDDTSISGLAIGCLDWTSTSSLSEALSKQAIAESYMPLTHGASETWAIQHECVGWPVAPTNPPKRLDVKTKTTILMVNSVADPETGYPWAIGMLEEIENKVLVTRKGDGHTSFSLGGETAQVIGKYLLTGEAPETDLFLDS